MKTLCSLLFLLTVLFPGTVSAQQDSILSEKEKKFGTPFLETGKYEPQGQDSIRVVILKEVDVITLRTFKEKKHQKRYDKLVRNVKKVYPYSKMAGERMIQYNEAMQNLTRKERKRLVKAFESEVKDKYGPELARLTPTQGKILLKLIDRQTQYTPYEIVEELRGSVKAFFYNVMASLFGFDLKEEYDPANNTEDKYIEEICVLIERGQL